MDFLKCIEFLVADVYCDTVRHMVFATHKQLELLSSCKRWLLDETFSVLGDPFASGQLESFHGFVCNDSVEKQLPMVFILMSRRRTEDYMKVFTSVRDALVSVNVENFIMEQGNNLKRDYTIFLYVLNCNILIKYVTITQNRPEKLYIKDEFHKMQQRQISVCVSYEYISLQEFKMNS
ncbi:hypothetical protein DPMN_151738 [Dreissena polymorpha]|uniref:Uncharacterized protein n=1 Tax=Dreissena polymorpha TaxID=45954 RepID=A0A9D4FJ21_DREPO|nr:hypothetical protein DPMN_151738 [Dreissena polymorpha]